MKQRNEEAEQAAVVEWVDYQYPPKISDFLYHTPNGGYRLVQTARRMKKMGVKRGHPDLVLPYRIGDCPGLVIEMKSPGGKLTDDQKKWLRHYKDQGWTRR